jgi:steroid delta-isomerase-like uncharacterized protein
MKSNSITQDNQAEQNKELIRRAVEQIYNGANYSTLDQFVADDFVVHVSQDEKVYGREGVKQFYTELRTAFPDLFFTIQDQIAESDRVVTSWKAEGTHSGAFKGIPATGKRVILTAVDIDRIVDGKVVECWTKMDELGLLNQLGAIPPPVAQVPNH